VILELGPAASKDLGPPRKAEYGATGAFEVTPIEGWLELEAGVSTLWDAGRPDTSVDLLFKKPYRLSSTVEFMVGLGPELVRSGSSTSFGAEGALDFMFWPYARRDFGWYVEPGYEVVFAHRTNRAIDIAGGLLIGWR
jgi:hypothetical protein